MSDTWKRWEGQEVGGCYLRQFLGGSERSAVFLTEYAEGQSQPAVIKLVTPEPADAESQLERWYHAAKLSHPHLLRIFRSGRCQLGGEDVLFLLTEFAEENLAQILPQRQLTPDEVREMLGPTLEALTYLHEQGLAHGRLKPANIMAAGNQLKLSTDSVAPTGDVNFAWEEHTAYDPPEAPVMSKAGDMWSLGITLSETLTQKLPAWQPTGRGEPIVAGTIPAPFLDIVHNCLLRSPQKRWTIAQVKARLQTPQSPAEHAAPTPRKAPLKLGPLITVGVVALALMGILVGQHMFRRRPVTVPIASAQRQAQPVAQQPPQIAQQPEPQEQPAPSAAEKPPAASTPAPSAPPSAPAESGMAPRLEKGVLHRVVPKVSQSTRDTITGHVKVRVRVKVDSSGKVSEAEFDSPGPSQYFARLAMQAAREWRFVPGTGEWMLRFYFGRTGTKVLPEQLSH